MCDRCFAHISILCVTLQWATKVLREVDVVPPGSGVGGMHQLNVESTVRGVCCTRDGWLYPDTVLGTDTHMALCNGLGVFSIREFSALFCDRMCSFNVICVRLVSRSGFFWMKPQQWYVKPSSIKTFQLESHKLQQTSLLPFLLYFHSKLQCIKMVKR